MPRVEIGRIDEIAEGAVKVLYAGDVRLAVGKIDGQVYAIEDLCSHDGGPLGEGSLCGFDVECPRHGALFDIRTGEALTLPATAGVGSFPVTLEGDRVFVEITEE